MFLKSIKSETVFTKTDMIKEGNVNFLQNTSYVEKSIESEAVLTKTEMNNEWNFNFLKNTWLFKH